jgi:Protein of Unknown function (DUF2784)
MEALNVGFFAFHTAWMLFNCVGWIWRRTRPWHLATIALTGASWFVLGIWYGWGYCPCTDWHWQVRERLGYRDPPSYTEMLFEQLTGIAVPTALANTVTVAVFVVVTVLSVVLNVRDRRALIRPD